VGIFSCLKLSLGVVTSKRNEHVAENSYRSSHVGGGCPERSFGAHRRMVALSPETTSIKTKLIGLTKGNLN
jgi:hypothetical protein